MARLLATVGSLIVLVVVVTWVWVLWTHCNRPTGVEVFLGRWQLKDDEGVVSSYLTITKDSARRDHAPDYRGRMTVKDGKLRIEWEDGFRDELRLEPCGSLVFAGLDASGKDRFKLWASPAPSNQSPGSK